MPDTQTKAPDWMNAEKTDAKKEGGKPVNKSFTAPQKTAKKAAKKLKEVPVERANKGFQVEVSRVRKWDQLVAALKSSTSNKKSGPELIDEAIDYLHKKYSKELGL